MPNIDFGSGTPVLSATHGEKAHPQCAPRPPGGAASLGEPRSVGGRGVSGPASQGPWAGLGPGGSGPKGTSACLLETGAGGLDVSLVEMPKSLVHPPKGAFHTISK